MAPAAEPMEHRHAELFFEAERWLEGGRSEGRRCYMELQRQERDEGEVVGQDLAFHGWRRVWGELLESCSARAFPHLNP